jgi:hypothetical protein
MKIPDLLIEQEINPEILAELKKDTPLARRLKEILSIVPDDVTVQEYARNLWYAYSEERCNFKS